MAAQQKRLLGLLAIIGLAGKQGISRDRIEAYLWPESTGEKARHSLDQTVYSIRNSLGPDSLISSGRELRLNPELIQVDVWAFEELTRAGQHAVAVGLYKGPLLDGFHFADSRELESWIDTNRNRLRIEYQTAIDHLAKASAHAGDHAESVKWLRQLVNSDPLSSDATKKLMLALAAAGDRAAAVKQARLYQQLVKQELEIEADSEIESLAATLSKPATAQTAVPSAGARAAENQPARANGTTTIAREPSTTPVKERSLRDRRLPYAVIAFGILISGAAVWGAMRPGQSKQVVRYTLVIDSAEAIIPAIPYSARVAISPDGTRFAYLGGSDQRLFMRPRNELHATAIPGTQEAYNPFFSPDGRSVAFLREKSIWIVPLGAAGPPIHVSDSLTGTGGASWGSDGFIYADGFEARPLARVEARQGAAPKWFTTLDTAKGEFDHTWPSVLPNGKAVLFTVSFMEKSANSKSSHAIALADIPSGKHRIIIEDAAYPVYMQSGYLLYVTPKRTLMMAPFDQNSMKVAGEATSVLEGMPYSAYGGTDLAVSTTGTLVYSLGRAPEDYPQELLWLSRDGKAQPVDPDWHGLFGGPALSPDGKRLAITKSPDGQTGDVWIKHLDGGPRVKLTRGRIFSGGSGWTPDGQSVTFNGIAAEGNHDLWTQRADGSAEAVLQFGADRNLYQPRWAPDRKWLIFETISEATGMDIFGIRPGIDTAPVPLVAGKSWEHSPDLSSDGRYLAYTSDETGLYQIYVVSFPNTTAAKWAISSRGGLFPKWSPRGNELFYRDTIGDVFAVGVRTAPNFSFDKPRRLFTANRAEFLFRGWAVSADAERFLLIRQLSKKMPDKLIVVENWFEELKGKSPKQE